MYTAYDDNYFIEIDDSPEHKALRESLFLAKNHFNAILEMLYATEALDTSNLQSRLEDVQYLLDVDFQLPNHLPTIARSQS